MKRVGFVINSRVPDWDAWQRGMWPHRWLTGWGDEGSPMHFMRFAWVAEEVNRNGRLRYELYRPWRRYDAVVFLKSMGPVCERFMERLRREGTRILFEANVDYYTEAPAANLPEELAPTSEQKRAAVAMTAGADGVLASSRRLAEICSGWTRDGRAAVPVADNILPRLVPGVELGSGREDGRLRLWWSGMPAKLYDFLLIREVLEKLPVHVHWVTGDWKRAIAEWPGERREEFLKLLGRVKHTFHEFTGIPDLLRLYRQGGGAIVSPRYLDSPYNHSHTEWKLTLGLACGLSGLGSPLPSYVDAAEVAEGQLQICKTTADWEEGLRRLIGDVAGARKVAEEGAQKILHRYGTPQIAGEHRQAVEEVLSR